MNINFLYDPSVSGAPPEFKIALNMVAQTASLYFTDPITINIQVGWGEIGGQALPAGELGAATIPPSSIFGLTYAQLKTDLMQNASSIADVVAIHNLPPTNPTGGSLIYVSSAQEKAWGLVPGNGIVIDGVIGFSATAPWDFNPNDGITGGFFDFVGAALHEVTHSVGRVLGHQFSAEDLLDLFDYSSPGHLAVNTGYFSIDGGNTPLNYFATFGDLADWSGTAGVDANNAFATRGQVNPFASADFTEMDVLGFSLNLPSADNVAVPALTTYQKMYSLPPSSNELWILKEFDAAQSLYGQLIGVQDPTVYVYQALGAALADGSDTGSTAFKSKWGPLAIPNDATFATQAYSDAFGAPGNSAQIQHFVDQVNFFKSLYTVSGAYGTDANHIDLLARGAIYGQMLGVKAENPLASAGSALMDTPLIGVSGQSDTTHAFT
jgi:hypothetical protein